MNQFEKYFRDRAVSAEVRDGRPYTEWTSLDHLHEILAPYYDALSPVERKRYRGHANTVGAQSPHGFVIHRGIGGPTFPVEIDATVLYQNDVLSFAFPADAKLLRSLYAMRLPQLHPTDDVVTDPRVVYSLHPSHTKIRDCTTEDGQPLHTRVVQNADGSESELLYAMIAGKETYIPWRNVRPRARMMRDHIDKRVDEGGHGGENTERLHVHDPQPGKYLFPPGEGTAAHLDVHPMALRRIKQGGIRRIYLAMEGCAKADSILTEILDRDEPSSVVSVLSVTLWRKAEEMEMFVEELLHLGSEHDGSRRPLPEIVLVPDADYRKNWIVRRQALLLRARLRYLGLNVKIAAPPPCDHGQWDPMHAECDPDPKVKCKANGVDDYLSHGGTLGRMLVFEREAPEALRPGRAWLAGASRQIDARGQRRRSDGLFRDQKFLLAFSECADPDGVLRTSLESLSTVTDLEIKDCERAARSCVKWGDLTSTEHELEARWQEMAHHDGTPIRGKRGQMLWRYDWDTDEHPVFTLAENLRAIESDHIDKTLGGPTMLDQNQTATMIDRLDLYRLMRQAIQDDREEHAVERFIADALGDGASQT